jgi:hypothetical protein
MHQRVTRASELYRNSRDIETLAKERLDRRSPSEDFHRPRKPGLDPLAGLLFL